VKTRRQIDSRRLEKVGIVFAHPRSVKPGAKILTDRYAGFHVETHANIQALQEPPVETGTIVAETVAGVNVGHESPVSVQRSDAKPIAE
jgi:hypothetical protein